MANPLVPQGILNRVRGSLTWSLFPDYNVTAPYLGRDGISLSLEGDATTFLPTMTGAVQSQEVYLPAVISLHLLKTQQLADMYKRKQETDSNFGACTIRPDVVSGGIGSYQITNCGIKGVPALVFNGTQEGFMVTIGGYYSINSSLFNAG